MPCGTVPIKGTTTRCLREHRGTTPLAALTRDRSIGCDGPTRSVLLGHPGCSSEGSPVIAGSMPLLRLYGASRNQSRAAPRGYLTAELACGRITPWSHRLG